VASTLELDELLNLITQQATTLLQADGGILNLVDWEKNEDKVVAATGLSAFTLGYRSPLEGSLSGWVALHNQPVISNQAPNDSRVDRSALSWLAKAQVQSTAIAPLTIKDQVMGTLVIIGTREGKERFDQADLDLLVAFASQAAVAIENSRLYEQAQQRIRELEALYRADAELYRHLSLDEVLQALVDIAVDILNADKSSLMVWDEARERLVARVARGFRPETMALLSFARGEGTMGHVAATGDPVIVEDALTDPRRKHERPEVVQAAVLSEGIRSFMHLPIKIGDEVFGVFSVIFTTPHTFGEDDLRLFTALAGRAALAIEHAQLHEQTQEIAVVQERNRVARELHDSVTQSLYGVTLYADAAARLLDTGQVRTATDNLRKLRRTAKEALGEMRLLIFELRPPILEQEGLVSALERRLEAVERRAGLETQLNVEGEGRLPPDVEEGLYRIALEALNNALKHAQARSITVSLRLEPRTAVLEIADDGVGFDLAAAQEGGGLGLRGMAERAEQLGGRLTVKSEPGMGTTVQVQVEVCQ